MGRSFVQAKMFFAGLLCAAIFLAAPLYAETRNPLIGKWVEKFANGNGMLTEFTETTISSASIDARGKIRPVGAPASITYKPLGYNKEMGDGYAVDFVPQNGMSGGGGILVYLKDSNTILMDFPGVGVHHMTRLKPESSGK